MAASETEWGVLMTHKFIHRARKFLPLLAKNIVLAFLLVAITLAGLWIISFIAYAAYTLGSLILLDIAEHIGDAPTLIGLIILIAVSVGLGIALARGEYIEKYKSKAEGNSDDTHA